MVWFFKEEGDRLKLVSGSSVFTVLKLERDDEEHTIKVNILHVYIPYYW